MSGMSIEPYFHPTNWTSESNFAACQNSLSEHSFEGVPAFLYNLTKSVPDPCLWGGLIFRTVFSIPNPLPNPFNEPITFTMTIMIFQQTLKGLNPYFWSRKTRILSLTRDPPESQFLKIGSHPSFFNTKLWDSRVSTDWGPRG